MLETIEYPKLTQLFVHASVCKSFTFTVEIQASLFKHHPFNPTRFSPVTYTNGGISSQNFLTFSFNPFVTLVSNFKAIPSASPKLLNSKKDPPPRKEKVIFLFKYF